MPVTSVRPQQKVRTTAVAGVLFVAVLISIVVFLRFALLRGEPTLSTAALPMPVISSTRGDTPPTHHESSRVTRRRQTESVSVFADDEPVDLSIPQLPSAFVLLTRKSELPTAVQALESLEASFNAQTGARYPLEIFHDDLQEEDQQRIRETMWKARNASSANAPPPSVSFHRLDFSWRPAPPPPGQPPYPERLPEFPGKSSWGYRHMCRFFAFEMPSHAALQKYRYVWRIDGDALYICPMALERDPFRVMQQRGGAYGWTVTMYEEPRRSADSLWKAVRDFAEVEERRGALPGGRASVRRLYKKWGTVWGSYSRCHYWNNFEILDLEPFRSDSWKRLAKHLEDEGGVWRDRWGDALIRTLGVALLFDDSEVLQFGHVGYNHQGVCRDPCGRASRRGGGMFALPPERMDRLCSREVSGDGRQVGFCASFFCRICEAESGKGRIFCFIGIGVGTLVLLTPLLCLLRLFVLSLVVPHSFLDEGEGGKGASLSLRERRGASGGGSSQWSREAVAFLCCASRGGGVEGRRDSLWVRLCRLFGRPRGAGNQNRGTPFAPLSSGTPGRGRNKRPGAQASRESGVEGDGESHLLGGLERSMSSDGLRMDARMAPSPEGELDRGGGEMASGGGATNGSSLWRGAQGGVIHVKRKEADGFKAHRLLHTPHAPTDDWGPQRPQSDVVVSEPQTAAKSFTAIPGFQGSDQGGETPFVQTAGTTFDFQGYSNAGESEFDAVLLVGLSEHEDAGMGSGDSQWEISQKAVPLFPESAPFIAGETEVAPMRIGRIELTRNAGRAERKREKQRAKRGAKQTERHAALLNMICSACTQDHEMPPGGVQCTDTRSGETS
uniref:Nucleotide-diphospho-sugar transferase domain-containing protein n=1 Tax=Chromera velia CCMP2878 TaxID=1169474 RepID=A0A0G4FFY6_9ALVE|eukprot:Cvel_3292.t1-p1 / transcript=Cvel_3292.t1 / gene=Cvel_3292 / organism=Chromera_velia_CCMP2878 / gene_product=Probable mannosyltransferase KTR4, putative / transcript_product=Probable mannosyltransferase KTR4, putative / location=Cvel_scaffold129:121096-126578(+) / protein_length=840 / sequence_SO=supercontig / SO=protein_coding / is_pseudo=false